MLSDSMNVLRLVQPFGNRSACQDVKSQGADPELVSLEAYEVFTEPVS